MLNKKLHYCFLKRFNNYFNRKIIRYETLEDYEDNSADFYIPELDNKPAPMDFNPNDNVMTEIIANGVPFDADYILIFDDDEEICYRWFIIEQKRNRQGQWTYTLKRDVIADHLDDLMDAPIFVQKGIVSDDNPLVLNDEGMSFNQIKTKETLLKDKSETSWIVGYMAKNAAGTDVSVTVPIKKKSLVAKTLDEVLNEMSVFGSNIKTQSQLLAVLSLPDDTVNKNVFYETLSLEYRATFVAQYLPTQAYTIEFVSPLNTLSGYSISKNFNGYLPITNILIDGSPTIPLEEGEDVADAIVNRIITNRANIYGDFQTILGNGSAPFLTSRDIAYFRSLQENNTLILYNGNYYIIGEIVADEVVTQSNTKALNSIGLSDLRNAFVNGCADYSASISVDATKSIYLSATGSKYSIVLESYSQTPDGDLETTISASRLKTLKQEFDAFAIPVNGVAIKNGGTTQFMTCEYAQEIASAIAIELDANLYDLQLLPYCPFPQRISEANTIDVSGMVEGFDYNDVVFTLPNSGLLTLSTDYNLRSLDATGLIMGPPYHYIITLNTPFTTANNVTLTGISVAVSDPNSTGIVAAADISYDTFTEDGRLIVRLQFDTNDWPTGTPATEEEAKRILIDNGINILYAATYTVNGSSVENLSTKIFYLQDVSFNTILDYPLSIKVSKKIDSNCDLYRIVSPNYQGTFEFNVAKNGGKVNYFMAQCTYKPYTPMIKVAPDFELLYGANYSDNRGLICGGDFSLPRATSAWENYQLNNKNYQNIFNREIQNMDVHYGLERRAALIGGVASIIGDAAKGAATGAIVGGGPIGAAIGGIVGGVTSSVGMALDLDTMARSYKEDKSFAIDKYNYQLGNIKALPNTLTKVGSFDIISKIFPVLEYYTCTDTEKIAFINKIKYESMTIMAIGYLNSYITTDGDLRYFKGELIRCDKIAEDSHIVDAIYAELLKGVYI